MASRGVSEEEIVEFFATADRNNDGQISMMEYMKGCKAHKKAQAKEAKKQYKALKRALEAAKDSGASQCFFYSSKNLPFKIRKSQKPAYCEVL